MSNLSTMIILDPENHLQAALSEIAPGVFILQKHEAAFEAALGVDIHLQSEYNAMLYNLDAFTLTDEVAPEIEYTYAPVIQHVRFMKAVEAGEPNAVAVAIAVDKMFPRQERNHIRITVAPFAHPIRAKL